MDLNATTLFNEIIIPNVGAVKSVAGSVLPIVIGAGVLVALVYWGYRQLSKQILIRNWSEYNQIKKNYKKWRKENKMYL
jgi:hypothetical protein